MPDGGFAIAGRTRSQGAGSNDVYVLRLNMHGQVLWSRTFGSVLQEQGLWIESLPDGGSLVTGYSFPNGSKRHDYNLIRLDASGNPVWNRTYGDNLSEMAFCGKPVRGGYAGFGVSRDGDTFGNFELVKTDSQGNQVWKQNYDAPWVDYGHEFWEIWDGGFMLFGSEGGFHFPSELDHRSQQSNMLLIRTDSLGDEVWRKQYGGNRHEEGRAIRPAANGGWYLFGSTQSWGAGSYDLYLVRVDAQGDTLWSKTYGGTDWDYGTSMDVDTAGNLYLLGTTATLGGTGSPDIYLIKTDSSGVPIWTLTLGEDSSDYGHCVRALPTGGCVITGDTRGSKKQDVYFAHIGDNGAIVLFSNGTFDPPSSAVYPNPVVDESRVMVPFPQGQPFEFRVYNAQGRLVFQQEYSNPEAPRISTADFSSGTYLYELVQRGKMRSKGKFVVY